MCNKIEALRMNRSPEQHCASLYLQDIALQHTLNIILKKTLAQIHFNLAD